MENNNMVEKKENYIENLIEAVDYIKGSPKTVICIIHLRNGFEIVTSASCRNEAQFDMDILSRKAKDEAISKVIQYESYRMNSEISNYYQHHYNRITTDKEGNEIEFTDKDIKSISVLPNIGKTASVFVNHFDGTYEKLFVSCTISNNNQKKYDAKNLDTSKKDSSETKDDDSNKSKSAVKKTTSKKTTTKKPSVKKETEEK